MAITTYQVSIINHLIHGSTIGYLKNKKGEYSHWIIGINGKKERIRSDTSKAIRRWMYQKINNKIL